MDAEKHPNTLLDWSQEVDFNLHKSAQCLVVAEIDTRACTHNASRHTHNAPGFYP